MIASAITARAASGRLRSMARRVAKECGVVEVSAAFQVKVSWTRWLSIVRSRRMGIRGSGMGSLFGVGEARSKKQEAEGKATATRAGRQWVMFLRVTYLLPSGTVRRGSSINIITPLLCWE